MASSRADVILETWEFHRDHRRLWEPTWQELGEFIQPRKSNVTFTRSPGQQQTERLFDSTAIHANELLSASMQGALTSGASQWFGLRIRGVELARDHQISRDLEWCAADMYDAIRQSNHASEFHEVYQDMVCFGIGGAFVEERDSVGSLRHQAMHPGEYCIEENADGYVDTVYREFTLTARAAAKRWEANVGAKVKSALDTNPTQRFPFLHVVRPTDDPTPGPYSRKRHFPFKSCYIDIESKKLMTEGGYHEFPYMTPRWSKTSGEVYGRGPGFTALPDIKTLNKHVEEGLRADGLANRPPIKVRDEGVIGTVKLQPAGLTHVRDMEAVQVLDLGGNFERSESREEKLKAAIRRIFFVDQLQLQEGPQMTAFEVQVRYELMQRILGPTLGRTEVELLNPYIERVFWVRLRASKPDSPYRRIADWAKENGQKLDIEYEGPLARSQRLQESVATQRFFNIVLPLAEADESVLDLVDLDEVVRMHAMSTGVPARVLATPEQVQAKRDGRKQAQESAAQLDATEKLAGAGGKMAPVLKALNEMQSGIQQTAAPSIVPSGVGG